MRIPEAPLYPEIQIIENEDYGDNVPNYYSVYIRTKTRAKGKDGLYYICNASASINLKVTDKTTQKEKNEAKNKAFEKFIEDVCISKYKPFDADKINEGRTTPMFILDKNQQPESERVLTHIRNK